MKARFTLLTAGMILSGFFAFPVLAASNKSIQSQVASLQKEVAALKSQVRADEASSGSGMVRRRQVAHTHAISDSDVRLQEYLPFDPDVPGQAYVSSGPYIGVPIQYAGTELIVNSPSVNLDLQLLEIRKSIITQLNATLGESGIEATHSHLLLSGVIEGQANYTNHGGAPSTTDINVTNMSFDVTILGPSDWILGFIEMSYNDGRPMSDVFQSTSNYRVSDSRVYLNKAFVTLGNLTCSPYYFTFGQFYVPFGTYSTVMVSDTLTKLLGRTKERAVEVGMSQQSKNSFYGSAYIFRGDAHVHSVAKVDNGGINLGYRFDLGFFRGKVGAGYLSNIADSAGMQLGTGFENEEQMIHRVPAYDLRASLSLGEHIDLIGEYIFTAERFNPYDMSYNNAGARPNALDLEAAFSFCVFDRPSSIGIGYGKSYEALAMGIPLTRESIVFNTSIWRNTLQSLEFRHDRQYAESAVATGAGDTPVTSQEGKQDNAVTLQFDYYF
jgi:hypothetical protein